MSLLHTIKYWGLAGFLMPVAILITANFQGGVFAWPQVAALLWPTWPIGIAAGSYAEPQPGLVAIFTAFAVGLNVIVYSLVGIFVSKLFLY